MSRQRRLLSLVGVLSLVGARIGNPIAAQEAPPEYLARMSFPRWVDSALAPLVLTGPYELELRLNPVLQLGDFDGDHRTDAAVFVRARATGKQGIVLVRRAGSRPIVLGAGEPIQQIGDDLRMLDIWRVEPAARGDRLIVEKSETATGAVVWDGRSFRLTLHGD